MLPGAISTTGLAIHLGELLLCTLNRKPIRKTNFLVSGLLSYDIAIKPNKYILVSQGSVNSLLEKTLPARLPIWFSREPCTTKMRTAGNISATLKRHESYKDSCIQYPHVECHMPPLYSPTFLVARKKCKLDGCSSNRVATIPAVLSVIALDL